MEANKTFSELMNKLLLEREYDLRVKGKIQSNRRLTKNYIATQVLNVSATWVNRVFDGTEVPNAEMLIKLANFFEVDEHLLFKSAKVLHPSIIEKAEKEYFDNLNT